MIARRDLIIAGACVVAAGAAAALKPRREVPLLKNAKLADVIPASFAGWTSEDVGDPYAVNGEGTLAAKLYNELVTRRYVNAAGDAQVMALFAYGGRQSDQLQLHRPEVCYPAFGYNLTRNEPLDLPVGGRAIVPARRLAAAAEGRAESIIYWSRMGEMIPRDGGEQRKARLEIAMQGIIPDGLLSRFSAPGDYPENDWKTIEGFVVELIAAVRPDMRKVLIGTDRAQAMRDVLPPQATLPAPTA
ncbi:MAG TPA: EpsI family protein [Phenylobacterium sp.]